MTKTLRQAYGEALVELGDKIVVLDGDLAVSTGTGLYAKKYPNRFFNMGIAEENLVSAAAGFALTGHIPFVSTYASFLMRAWEQIRHNAYCGLNIKYVTTHAGLATGEAGVTHQSVEDIALMRTIPNMRIYSPASARQTKEIIKEIAEIKGPCYVRLPRPPLPNVDKSRITGSRTTVFATGIMFHEALRIPDVNVINVCQIKPLDEEVLPWLVISDRIITMEDHNIVGGLGDAIGELLLTFGLGTDFKKIGVKEFAESGSWKELLQKYFLKPI